MPIECSAVIEPLDQDSFHQIDRQVMGEVFAIHNSIGKFFDETIYQSELAERCKNLGIDVGREIEIRAAHGGFIKSYFLDLLVAHGSIYELKIAATLNSMHSKQLIHYLLLTGLNHGKLVNFRPSSVESRFISTRLRNEDRMQFTIDSHEWAGHDTILEARLLDLLNDWGAFLDADHYRDALLHFTSSPGAGVQLVPVILNGRLAGHLGLYLLDPESAWHISAIHEHHDSYEIHIRRMLAHTPLSRLHWINLNQRQVTLKTLIS